MAEHIVILNDHEKEAEEADMEVIFLLLNLRDLRTRYHLSFNITVEMNSEHNERLVGRGDNTDYLVDSSMSSLILAQLAQSIDLIGFFREILSNRGNELYLKNVSDAGIQGTCTVRELRRLLYRRGMILLGYIAAGEASRYDLSLDEMITLRPEDSVIVLSEN